MTMKLTIKNEDTQRVARYEIEDVDVRSGRKTPFDSREISPGETCTLWIHAARQVVITEDPHAIRRANKDES